MNVPDELKEVLGGEVGDERTTLVFDGGKFRQKELRDVRKDDVFMLIEPFGEIVSINENTYLFKATSDPYKREDGVWTVDSEAITINKKEN